MGHNLATWLNLITGISRSWEISAIISDACEWRTREDSNLWPLPSEGIANLRVVDFKRFSRPNDREQSRKHGIISWVNHGSAPSNSKIRAEPNDPSGLGRSGHLNSHGTSREAAK